MIHSNEMEAALIVRDQEPGKVTSSLPEDLENRIRGIARKCGMGLPVPFNNTRNCKASHPALSISRDDSESRHGGFVWNPIS